MLSAGTKTEIFSRHKKITLLYPGDKSRFSIFQYMFDQLREEDCDLLVDLGVIRKSYKCYTEVAISNVDPAICDGIENNEYEKDNCVTTAEYFYNQTLI